MDNSMSSLLKKLSQYESEISSILGMLVVAALAVFIFLFVKKFMPKPSISPVAEDTQSAEDLMKQNGSTYTVKAGQGLSQVAKEALGNGKRWVEIAQANDLKAPYTIEKGQILKLPENTAAQPETVTPTDASVAKVEKLAQQDASMKAEESKTPANDSYVVQKGDSLWKIAVAQYGSGYAWTKVYKANMKLIGKNPGRLFVGTSLVMPKQ